MQVKEKGLLFSPSDLITFMESPFASSMDRLSLLGHLPKGAQKDRQDPLMNMLAEAGHAHEAQVVKDLKVRHPDLVEIPDEGDKSALSAMTFDAMDAGASIITQGYLSDGSFAGHTDFLVRTDQPSVRWDWSYEVWDAKLARSIKPYFIIQLACYSELLGKIQGTAPRDIVVITGDNIHHRFELLSFAAYYRALKRRFLNLHSDLSAGHVDPALDWSHGRWKEMAEQQLVERDHLSLVANIRRTQIAKLEAAGCTTLSALAELGEAAMIPRLNSEILNRLRTQARLQRDSDSPPPLYEVVSHTNEGRPKGLDALPPASVGDIFFDLEGHPGQEGGLEYLWGATFFDEDGNVAFRDLWGHDAAGEEEAFTNFVDWAYARWQAHPDMHIYHYAPYEITALRKLMGRTGKREDEVDELLRNERFVDLYGIVKNGVVVGETAYSIKNLENLYWSGRGGRNGIQSGGESIEIYERWRNSPDGETVETSELLRMLYDYNKEDCDSTLALTEWLRSVQVEHDVPFRPFEGPPKKPANEKKMEQIEEKGSLSDEMIALQSSPCGMFSPESLSLLGHSLHFHRREAKPVWWRYFDRRSLDHEELYADHECLVHVRRTDTPPYKKGKERNLRYEYAYDIAQPYKGTVKSFRPLEDEMLTLPIKKDDTKPGFLVFSSRSEPPISLTLIPCDIVPAGQIPNAIQEQVERTRDGELPSQALTDILERRAPRGSVAVSEVATHRDNPEQFLNTLKDVVRDLAGGALCIQGPPGSGKTYTASHLIEDLLARGARIGITSNSHKAIENLMEAVQVRLADSQTSAAIFKVGGEENSTVIKNGAGYVSTGSKYSQSQGPCLVGGTAWFFANTVARDGFDYLFIDEAGQFALANLIGVSRAATNLVLLGDQMQLSQPVQGVHPGDSGLSCLEYVLAGQPVMPDDLGVFLPATYRMHPDICSVISEQVYSGRLSANKVCDDHVIHSLDGDQAVESSIIWHPIEHAGNEQSSTEEAEAVATLIEEYVGRPFGIANPRALELADILVVTPYNAQRETLTEYLPEGTRIGTVDLFQGQEAPIVIVSMGASSAELAPRGIEFLFSKNRLNVAVSRAQALVIIVGSPELVEANASSVSQMKEVNFFCTLQEAGLNS